MTSERVLAGWLNVSFYNLICVTYKPYYYTNYTEIFSNCYNGSSWSHQVDLLHITTNIKGSGMCHMAQKLSRVYKS